ncbi:MAG: hypothetical protein NZM40_03020 [Sphingomonadaceae bacterium]|nr:hypothetical protein [Sphingomonadaceae bacterium]
MAMLAHPGRHLAGDLLGRLVQGGGHFRPLDAHDGPLRLEAPLAQAAGVQKRGLEAHAHPGGRARFDPEGGELAPQLPGRPPAGQAPVEHGHAACHQMLGQEAHEQAGRWLGPLVAHQIAHLGAGQAHRNARRLQGGRGERAEDGHGLGDGTVGRHAGHWRRGEEMAGGGWSLGRAHRHQRTAGGQAQRQGERAGRHGRSWSGR